MSILFAILTIIAGLFLPFICGYIGLGVTAVFFALALVFAIKKKKSEGSGVTGSIIAAVIGLVIGISVIFSVEKVADNLVEEAKKNNCPIVEKYFPSLKTGGIIGLVSKISNDNVDMDALDAELKVLDIELNLSDSSDSSGSSVSTDTSSSN